MTPIRLGGRRSKYGAVRQEEDGIKFDSTAERNRYRELNLLALAGEIRGVLIHPRFTLEVNKQKICDYVADFSYFTRNDDFTTMIVEDVKGAPPTPVFLLKTKLMMAIHGIAIREVDQHGNLRERGRKKKERDE